MKEKPCADPPGIHLPPVRLDGHSQKDEKAERKSEKIHCFRFPFPRPGNVPRSRGRVLLSVRQERRQELRVILKIAQIDPLAGGVHSVPESSENRNGNPQPDKMTRIGGTIHPKELNRMPGEPPFHRLFQRLHHRMRLLHHNRMGTHAGNDLQPGDLVLFRHSGSSKAASHVGIFIGSGQFIHASTNDYQVRIDNLSSPWYANIFIGGRHIA